MALFAYRAVDNGGARKHGTIEAASPIAARRLLREQALLPIAVAPAIARRMAPGWPRPGRIGVRALATVTRQISTLVSSDIPVEEALRLIARQTESTAIASLVLDLRAMILDGRGFAGALAAHPGVFPGYFRASVAAGEQSGKLAEVLAHLADFVERRHRNRQKVHLALLYPALLAAVSLGMILLLLVYVVPGIVTVFVARGAELPLLTRGLIALSTGLHRYGLLLAAALGVAALLVRRWTARPANRLRLAAWFANTPPFARFVRQHNAARFAASLATLVQSAVPLVEALHAAAAVTPNRYVRDKALAVADRVSEGASLRVAMAEVAIFPAMLTAIVASGESSGRLGPALDRAAAELERELEALMATLVALVEPAVLLLMGGLVLLMVLAILLPIIALNSLAVL